MEPMAILLVNFYRPSVIPEKINGVAHSQFSFVCETEVYREIRSQVGPDYPKLEFKINSADFQSPRSLGIRIHGGSTISIHLEWT